MKYLAQATYKVKGGLFNSQFWNFKVQDRGSAGLTFGEGSGWLARHGIMAGTCIGTNSHFVNYSREKENGWARLVPFITMLLRKFNDYRTTKGM